MKAAAWWPVAIVGFLAVNVVANGVLLWAARDPRGPAIETDYYPEPLRASIDAVNACVYAHVNNGVYRCGFASSQVAYERAFDALFSTLGELETQLSASRYLVGDALTEEVLARAHAEA